MRIALISDLHANLLALEAVLADIRRRGVDRLLCLGDVATLGPRPKEILALLRDLGSSCILGNHDEFLFNPGLTETYTEAPIIVRAIDWARAELSTEELAFVRGFLPRLEIPVDADTTLLFFHGSPRSHMEDLLATTPPEELDRLLDGHRALLMSGGHTHLQMLRQHRGALLVNPGSVGLPFLQYVGGGPPQVMPHAEYAIVEAEHGAAGVELRRVPLSKAALARAASDSRSPFAPMLAAQYA
jgi:predicted phosphodiesterase